MGDHGLHVPVRSELQHLFFHTYKKVQIGVQKCGTALLHRDRARQRGGHRVQHLSDVRKRFGLDTSFRVPGLIDHDHRRTG